MILIHSNENKNYPFLTDDAISKLKSLDDVVIAKDADVFYEALKDAEILITGWGAPKLPEDVCSLPKLKYIHHLTGTLRAFLPRTYIEGGKCVVNWGNEISDTIAEHTLALTLSCLRNICPRQNDFECDVENRSLLGASVAILGFGSIGEEFAKLLAPFRVSLKIYDPYISDEKIKMYDATRAKTLKEAIKGSRVVSVHIGLNEKTYHLLNEEFLSSLEKGTVLINTSRGGVIDEASLASILKSRADLTAGLDVFEQEPLSPFSPLRKLQNCVLTPHIAGPMPERYYLLGNRAVKYIKRYIEGKEISGILTLEQYDRMT